ncbi:Crp/Fnr family transcriptional regulator [Fibrella aquatilis]|uniref:Crp/Fnr family transcriptional regulator n=1 Tax=Fibrella aquatilis TaxID=2817059 RepID=A0A939JWI2_9BACT|nr:Crp/Fnr family transcriptional regulator [Fibrella aquatilis]MBO0931942.1 Crp/Fnr family transcriptional regulator [Fibrella aquatilis]
MFDQLCDYIQCRHPVTAAELADICLHFTPCQAPKGTLLVYEGAICQQYPFVNQGALRMYFVDRNGHEQTRYFALEGSFGSALASFIYEEPAVEFVEALEPVSLLLIRRPAFYHLVDTVPAFAFVYREILEQAYRASVKRIGSFMAMDARQRFEWVLANQPHLLQRVSGRILASYLDMTPETLSRLKKEVWNP